MVRFLLVLMIIATSNDVIANNSFDKWVIKTPSARSITNNDVFFLKYNGAKMNESDFSEKFIFASSFAYADGDSATFNHSEIFSSTFKNSHFHNSDFRYCEISDTSFENSDLTNSSFDNSILTNVSFSGSILTNVDFTNTK